MKHLFRNQTSLILVVAVTFSAAAIPLLSGFLEPSPPPAVAEIVIGVPGEGDAPAGRPAGAHGERLRPEDPRKRPAAPAPTTQVDDASEDDAD